MKISELMPALASELQIKILEQRGEQWGIRNAYNLLIEAAYKFPTGKSDNQGDFSLSGPDFDVKDCFKWHGKDLGIDREIQLWDDPVPGLSSVPTWIFRSFMAARRIQLQVSPRINNWECKSSIDKHGTLKVDTYSFTDPEGYAASWNKQSFSVPCDGPADFSPMSTRDNQNKAAWDLIARFRQYTDQLSQRAEAFALAASA